MTAPRIVIMAGGTGGHIFPGLAVADELRSKGWQVSWLGTADRMESRIVPQHGYEIDFIEIQGLRGHGLLRKLQAPFRIIKAISQCRALFKQRQPNVVLGMGGYASGPGGVAAKMLGVPLILHEQNAVAGMTNKWLSRLAARIMCAFPGTFREQDNAKVVGNPVRQELFELHKTGSVIPECKNILIVGGSLGAKALNVHVPAAMNKVSGKFNVWHQSGRNNQAAVEQAYQQMSQQPQQLNVSEFIDDMEAAYAWADIIICRAGALTVAEVAATGSVAVFVPFPHAVDDHQTRNAAYLVEQQAACLVSQQELERGALSTVLADLLNTPEQLAAMAKRAKAQARPKAATEVAEQCQALLGKAVNI